MASEQLWSLGPADNHSGDGTSSDDLYSTATGMPNSIIEALQKSPLYRIFLILSLVLYGVIAFSKGEKGVLTSDITNLILYVFTIMILSSLFAFLVKIYRLSWDEFLQGRAMDFFYKNRRYFIILLFLLAVFVLLLSVF